ncbi:MAG: hypothetical protein AUG51_24995 [Acidobacteria bacterium 13_1_20CM_3_53_8]|nr:MAG: hypothetical protein AUG51_24995 [Acidobacteria bacterium 13_1_20CM_3_53_8]
MAGFSFTSFGLRIGVRSNDEAALERIIENLPPGWKPSTVRSVERLYSILIGKGANRPGVRRFNLLYEDHIRVARTLDPDELFESFESTLRLYVAEFAKRRLFIHAGVVGWRGRAILIPGRSFSGKTTLVSELLRAGATYYSDEYAVLDERGRVHPFPKKLSMRESGDHRQNDTPVEAFGGRAGSKPLPVGLVIASQYKEGARWRPVELTPGQGALTLLANTVAARREPEKAIAILQQVVSNARVLKGARGEAKEMARSVLGQLDEINSVPFFENDGKLPVELRSS